MKRVFPYYNLEAVLRYELKAWPEQPHIYLANMLPGDLGAFTRIFGPLFRNMELARDGGRGFAMEAQEVLRKAWRNDPVALRRLAEGKPERPATFEIPGSDARLRAMAISTHERFHLSITEDGIEIVADDLWSYLGLAFLRDHKLERAHICANETCKTPYFLQSKRGQLFCSHTCAIAANVRRFRAREADGRKRKQKKTRKRGKT